jgi:glycosyltransferase involved in cell wall biosynthesis
MGILHVLPHLGFSNAARELRMLLRPGDSVCGLGPSGPALATLRKTGAIVECLGWKRWLDPRPLWRLARLIHDWQPDLIHVRGLAALRVVRVATSRHAVVVSRAVRLGKSAWGRLDRRLLRGVAAVLVSTQAEAQACRKAGVPPALVRVVPPGIVLPPQQPTLQEPPAIVCLGCLRHDKGFDQAIWAFDIVHFACPDAELMIAGDGPERSKLQAFANNIEPGRQIHFLGQATDPVTVLARSSVVSVPSRTDTGLGVMLEAMAAGRPVVASHWPSFAEIIQDGETGMLAPPGDKMQFARLWRRILVDAQLRRHLGEAARYHVAQHYSAERFVAAWRQECRAAA